MGNSPSSPSPLQTCLNTAFAPGTVAYPGGLLYQLHDVKPFNLEIPVVPAAVVRPNSTQQVAAAVRCAVASKIKVQPKSGGHSFGNYGLGGVDGALVVDLQNLQKFSMNHDTWFATFGSGTLLGDLTDRLSANGGRAIAHGTCPQVRLSAARHLTIGGLGPLSRQWGTALDHVEEVEVVLANSTITRASPTQNPDLFFALKGAAAGFGIITEFVVHTQAAPTTAAIRYSYNIQSSDHTQMANTFATWQSIIADPNLDRKLASQVTVMPMGMVITGTYFGTQAEYKALNFESRLAVNATTSITVFNDWLGLAANWGETEALKLLGGIPSAFYAKSMAFTNKTLIPQNTIHDLFNYIQNTDKGTLLWFVIFDLAGGKTNDISQDATAYAHRDALFFVQSYGAGLISVSSTTKSFLTGINKLISNGMPNADFGAYAGYVDPALGNAQHQYWGTNLPRLQRIKTAVDPTDVFHNPQSVVGS
ncbi:FAD-binding domain-containing protein [Pluteus cervinus]|uniref:FAD-binding domain-containing protein n=1 Tax=Pluteus cervinus TaxID=181527 RepID=A0ACD3A7C8_9AGAR|nr:FAD-binding domain-containing protein [Pluteus cervinus]